MLAFAIGVTLVRSRWFSEKIRAGIVSAAETATGGRVELGGFRLDWRKLRVEILSFTLHGNEPDGKPPLFRASSVAVGLKIVSVLKRDVNVQYLDVVDP